jgi:hypothetical protein
MPHLTYKVLAFLLICCFRHCALYDALYSFAIYTFFSKNKEFVALGI